MKATLSYPYIGERFPDLNATVVVVKDMATLADIPYMLLKNRMGMKRTRTEQDISVFITDTDLLPRRKTSPKKGRRQGRKTPLSQNLSAIWLRKPII